MVVVVGLGKTIGVTAAGCSLGQAVVAITG